MLHYNVRYVNIFALIELLKFDEKTFSIVCKCGEIENVLVM